MKMNLQSVTEAVQATERLKLQLKAAKDDADDSVFQKCVETLDNLKSIKSSLDGSDVNMNAPNINDDDLQELRQLTLMHVPTSVTDSARDKMKQLILKTFGDCEVEVLFISLMTCPWYSFTQKERGESAKHNYLFIVYQSLTEKFVSPVNAHLSDQINVIDKGWFYACELYHFVQFIAKGKTRNVEALYCPPEAVIYQTDLWKQLRTQLDHNLVTGLRSFREACKGQSVGGIGKKGKDGKFRMKDATTFRELCDSFRLMHHSYNSVKKLPPCTVEFEGSSDTPDIVCKALDKLKSMYQDPDASKRAAFEILVEWQGIVDQESCGNYSKPEDVHEIVGNWHLNMRMQGKPPPLQRTLSQDQTELLALMEKIGGPVVKLQPEQILLITQAGSYMYGLSTPTSDVDYLVVYAEQTKTYLTACKRLPESFESRGPQKQIEYGAYEVRCFAEMLHKGSVVILELVFKDDHNYMSPAWKVLYNQREQFISEKAIDQYMGLIKNNVRMIQNGKHKDSPQERKLFYQIYHKLDSLEYLINSLPPPVKCSGPIRDFIMRVRTAPLEGDLSRENLYRDVVYKVEKMKSTLANRRTRQRENCNFDLLVDWIMTVRGLSYN